MVTAHAPLPAYFTFQSYCHCIVAQGYQQLINAEQRHLSNMEPNQDKPITFPQTVSGPDLQLTNQLKYFFPSAKSKVITINNDVP